VTESIPGGFDPVAEVYPLDTRHEDLQPGVQLLVDAGPAASPRFRTATVSQVEDGPETLGPLADTVTRVRLRQTIQGRPMAAVRPGGGRFVVARGGTGTVLSMEPDTSTRWEARTGIAASEDPAVVALAADRVDLFARDGGGRLQYGIWTPATWSGWSDLGGILTSRPAPLPVEGPQTLVFARGLDAGLWVIRLTAIFLLPWEPLGGILTSEPEPVSWGGPRADVFVRGLDRGLWRIWWDGLTWSAWESLGGVLDTAPSAAAPAMNRLDVVALSPGGALVHRRWTGTGWSDWRDLGGRAKGRPAIVATGPDLVEVFVRGEDDQLWHIARTGTTWSGWVSLGGALSAPPTAVAGAGGTLHVHARAADGSLVARTRTGNAWGGWTPLGRGLGEIPERRQTRLWQIRVPDLVFREHDYPALAGGRLAVRLDLAPGLEKLDRGRRLLIEGRAAAGPTRHLARVTASQLVPSRPGEIPDHLLVDFAPPLPAPVEDAVLHGNVAEASHGETQPDETLGNGDATRTFQRFRLSRAPLTYIPSETEIAGVAELQVRVNGALWLPVPSLYGRRAGDRVYTLAQTDEGETLVTFGDGTTGARLPTGAANVMARYRTGLGLAGRVKPEQLSILLERPVGLRAVTNPLPADGGADPEPRDAARTVAPTTVRTFGRAVSLMDFESLAATSGLVARAYATWIWHRLEKTVHLTVAAAGGARLSAESLGKLYRALTAARDPNRPLLLANLIRVPLVVRARLLRDPALEADAVLAAARAALLAHLDFAVTPLGRAVHASDVYAVLQTARGVVAVDVDVFHLKGYATLPAGERAVRAVTTDPVQPHVRIFPARPTPADATLIDRYARAGFEGPVPPPALAAEQAFIEDPVADVDLVLVEAF
jgi:hypothetical protein